MPAMPPMKCYGDERKRHGTTLRVSSGVGSAPAAEPESIRVGTRERPQAYGAKPPPKAPKVSYSIAWLKA